MLLRERWLTAGAFVAALALSCGNEAAPASGAGAGGSSSGAGGTSAGAAGSGGTAGASGGSTGVPTVTWAADIAPIAFRECAGCHREGGIAPFSLTSYADARQFAHSIMVATAERYMPPMPVDNSGTCNTYSNARWLTDAEIALFGAWYAQGAPEGDPARLPERPTVPAGLERADATVAMPGEYTPSAERTDDYRCFVVDPGLAEDTHLVAYEVLPGDARVVHHAILFQPKEDSDAADAEALDAAEDGLGYTCFGAPRVESDPVALWAPGGGVTKFPEDTGVAVIGGRKLVLQVHYNTSGGVFPDRTSIRLQVEPRVERVAYFQAIADQDLNIAPGQELGMTTRTHPVDPPAPVTIYGVLPHMHTLGRTLRLDADFPDGDRCLVNVEQWNFHWQNAWWYKTPIKGSVSSVTIGCGYDTRSRTSPVTWGEGTNDEMCLVYLYVTVP